MRATHADNPQTSFRLALGPRNLPGRHRQDKYLVSGGVCRRARPVSQSMEPPFFHFISHSPKRNLRQFIPIEIESAGREIAIDGGRGPGPGLAFFALAE